MTYKTKTLALEYTPHVRRAAALLSLAVALLLFLYGFFLLEAVAHTAGRAQAIREANELTSKLSLLEKQYLSAAKTMTLERAKELGFVSPQSLTTVYASAEGKGLSLRAQ